MHTLYKRLTAPGLYLAAVVQGPHFHKRNQQHNFVAIGLLNYCKPVGIYRQLS